MKYRRKRFTLQLPTKTEGFDQFNELRPMVNKKNNAADGAHEIGKCRRKIGHSVYIYNYIQYANGFIKLDMKTFESSMDTKSSVFNRCLRGESF